MEKITDAMRNKLREPLPSEAVSQHPTKTYLSSIKSIYVAERINDVFGVGSWMLKSEVIERIEKFVVVKAFLEISEYGFYGEAYGGNDNIDIGDAYKGATTDAFTKIAAQQLEVGIDVFKGTKPDKTHRQEIKQKSSDSSGELTTEELFSWIATNMNWKSAKTARTWAVNVCNITEERLDSNPSECKEEIKTLQGWT